MVGEKDILDQRVSKLNLANTYLKNGIYVKAREKFLELNSYDEYKGLIAFALQLCDLKINSIEVEYSPNFFEEMLKISLKTNNVNLYLEAYKSLVNLKGQEFVQDTFVDGILDKFDLCNTMTFDELKSFIDKYSDSYLYLNLLNEASSDYFDRKKWDEGYYFVKQALKISEDNEKAKLNVLFYKTKCSNLEELVNLSTPLYDYKEFEDLLEINSETYFPLIKKQENVLIFKNAQKAMMDKMKKDVENKKEKEASKKRNFTLRTLGLVSPIIVNVIFGIILFVNITQISIISNSPLWCAAWVIFSFFTICTSISFLQERDADIEDDDETVTTSAVLPIIMAVASVIVFCHAITLKFDFDPPTFIKMTATNKEESITSQGNTTKIYFLQKGGKKRKNFRKNGKNFSKRS